VENKNKDGTFEVLYEDGDKERSVPARYLRPRS
jgi:hypothetical protein